MRLHRVRLVILLIALSYAGAITFGLISLSRQTAILKSLEHWTSDWRAALLADRAASQHPRLAVVLIDDDTMQGYPYRSPIDRGLLARLIDTLDAAGVGVIALDFLFDQPTEPDKDRQLQASIRNAAAKVVLGTVDQRVPLRAERRAYLASFEAQAAAPTGYLNLRYEIDNVIRGEADQAEPAAKEARPSDSFAMAIARKAGATVAAPASRIAWLGTPADGSDAFLSLPAAQLVAPTDEAERRLAAMLLAGLKNRVVLVGGDMSDQNDRHPTPILKLGGGPMLGVMIHAHAVAQLLDGRRLHVLDPLWETGLVFAMALFGFLLGWRFRAGAWITSTLPIVMLAGLDAILFSTLRIILPFAAPAIAWILAIYAARAGRWLVRRATA